MDFQPVSPISVKGHYALSVDLSLIAFPSDRYEMRPSPNHLALDQRGGYKGKESDRPGLSGQTNIPGVLRFPGRKLHEWRHIGWTDCYAGLADSGAIYVTDVK